MKKAKTGYIEGKREKVMNESRHDRSVKPSAERGDDCPCGGCQVGNNNSLLPWDTRVTRDNNFATEVWKVCDEIGNLLIDKQVDYGPNNINNAHGGPINGLLVRIGDKFERLKNLFSTGKKPNHESIEDSFKDLANYAIIALMVERGTWPKK